MIKGKYIEFRRVGKIWGEVIKYKNEGILFGTPSFRNCKNFLMRIYITYANSITYFKQIKTSTMSTKGFPQLYFPSENEWIYIPGFLPFFQKYSIHLQSLYL